jgi:dsRNA-specific ribonuclease
VFFSKVFVDGKQIGSGNGRTRKGAETEAAIDALVAL